MGVKIMNFREKTQSIASQIGQNRHCRYYKNDIKGW